MSLMLKFEGRDKLCCLQRFHLICCPVLQKWSSSCSDPLVLVIWAVFLILKSNHKKNCSMRNCNRFLKHTEQIHRKMLQKSNIVSQQ